MNAVPDRLLPLPEVQNLTNLSRPEIYRRVKRPVADGGLPPPVKVGRRSMWRMSEIQNWIASLSPESNAA